MDLRKHAADFKEGKIFAMEFARILRHSMKTKADRKKIAVVLRELGFNALTISRLFGIQKLHPDLQNAMEGQKSKSGIMGTINLLIAYDLSKAPIDRQVEFWEQIKPLLNTSRRIKRLNILRAKPARLRRKVVEPDRRTLLTKKEESAVDPDEVVRRLVALFSAHKFVAELNGADFRRAFAKFGLLQGSEWVKMVNEIDAELQRLVKPRLYSAKFNMAERLVPQRNGESHVSDFTSAEKS